MPIPINISASRGSAILGLSNWSTPVQVWLKIMESRQPGFCAKHNYELPVFEESAALRWGLAFESAIVELASKKHDTYINDRERLFNHALFNYITCHIDGQYRWAEGILRKLHEGKTTSQYYFKDNFGEPGTDQVPIDYQIQCQHQMICTGAEKVILSVLVFPKRVDYFEELESIPMKIENGIWRIQRKDGSLLDPGEWAMTLDDMGYFHQYEINAHPYLQELMIKNYTEFWNKNVLKETPPEPKSYDDIKALVREPVGTIVADEHIEHVMNEYKQIKQEISTSGPLAKRADEIKVYVLEYMNGTKKVLDDDTQDKWILRDRAGKKIAGYGKNKNGNFIFR